MPNFPETHLLYKFIYESIPSPPARRSANKATGRDGVCEASLSVLLFGDGYPLVRIFSGDYKHVV